MKDAIEIKVKEIANVIQKSIIRNEIPEHLGLYDGKFGILIFLYYYSIYSKDSEFIQLTDNYTDKLLYELIEKKVSHTFCSGLSGILYGIDFLRLNNFVDIDIEDVEPLFNDYIIAKTDLDIQNNHHNFMHGALGAGLYFIKKRSHLEEINKLIEHLYQTAEKDKVGNRICWKSSLGLSGKRGYNIALSHGISSIILFLSRIKQADIIHPYLDELLKGSVNYVLSQEIDYNTYGCYFPCQSKEKPGKSRLAWCYGDLGVAYALWRAGKVTHNENWKNKALEVFIFSANRRSILDTMTQDAGICHGTAGIVMFFNRIYKETNLTLFKEVTDYWIKETLNYASFKEDGLVGYRTYGHDKNMEEELNPDYPPLTGIAGIGLVLLTHLHTDQPQWDELFLLS